MIPGYNAPRPTKKNYDDFFNKLVDGLRLTDIRGLGLLVYGSVVRKEMNYGRSDIDAVLVFDDDTVINKRNLQECSTVLSWAMEGNNVPFQVTVTDRRTMQDGRFNAYNPSFRDYFMEEGLPVFGPDYRREFRFAMPDHPDQNALTFNLRKCRQGLLFAEHDSRENYELFLQRFGKSLDAVSRGSKQVLGMIDGRVRKNRFSALSELEREFPKIDSAPLERIRHLYTHLDELDALYSQPKQIVEVWQSSLTFLEELIRRYMNRFPSISKPRG